VPTMIRARGLPAQPDPPVRPAGAHPHPHGARGRALMISFDDLPAFKAVLAGALHKDLDVERMTFSIDDEVDHALAFVEVAFQA